MKLLICKFRRFEFLALLLFTSCVHKDLDNLDKPKIDPNDRRSRVEVEQESARQNEVRKKDLLVNPPLGVTQFSEDCKSVTAGDWRFPYSCKYEWVVHIQLQCKLTSDQAMPEFLVPLRYKEVEIDTDNANLKDELKQKFPIVMQTSTDGGLQFAMVSTGAGPFSFVLRRNGVETRVTEDMINAPIVVNLDFCGTKKQ